MAEMAHFSLNLMTSGTLVSRGIQQVTENDRSMISAKKRRLSRPNTREELRMKQRRRRKLQRERDRKMSNKDRREEIAMKVEKETRSIREKLEEKTKDAKEYRKRAVYFWKIWRQGLRKHNIKSTTPRQIERENIKNTLTEEKLGEGRFGFCEKKTYRGKTVAVKYFKDASVEAVHNEAANIIALDHPGLPYVFGVCTAHKPYLLVMEYHGINGTSVTIAQALRVNLLSNQVEWAEVLLNCSRAIAYMHSNGKIHCDLKADNIILQDVDGKALPVIIDFGKMKNICDARVRKLSSKDQEHYRKHHKHIAPEIVRGTHPPSPASDVYAFGLVISLVCHYNRFEKLRLIAVKCIHGTPEKRPRMNTIIENFITLCTTHQTS